MPALTPWIAAQDTPNGSPDTAYRAIFTNRLYPILTATGGEATARPQDGADSNLIEADQADHASRHETFQHQPVSCLVTDPILNLVITPANARFLLYATFEFDRLPHHSHGNPDQHVSVGAKQ